MSYNEVFLIGSLICDRYEILKRLGKGGGGRVYFALDRKMADSPRAIKQMSVEFLDYDQYSKAIEDFKREAKVLTDLEHPSIPKIYDYFTQCGYFFLVMKYIEGKSLEQMLKESPDGRLPEKTVTLWGIQLCDTLSYLHSLNPPIIYRDMKPANIMYDKSVNRVFLIDFGIARYVQSSIQLVTAIGTIGYAPPELYQGRVMPVSDIYSLGATMFHLITGIAPDHSPLNGFDFSINLRPRQINDKMTEQMKNILIKAVQVEPEDRFASAKDMKSVLEEHFAALDNELNEEENIDPPKAWNSYKSPFETMPGDVDQLLLEWNSGDQKALDNLMPLVYKELYSLADDYLNRKRRAPSLQTATLINEVYSRLIESNEAGRQNRVQFFAVAAKMMRNILVDHARNRPAARRGKNKISLSDADSLSQRREVDLIELDYALNRLESIDPQQSRILELRYIGGLSIEEIAEVIGISTSTVNREWKIARMWLLHELSNLSS